jgi:hypothetical protein
MGDAHGLFEPNTVSHTGERAVAGTMAGLMKLGDEVTWEANYLGRTWRLSSRVTEYGPPRRFVADVVSVRSIGLNRRLSVSHALRRRRGVGLVFVEPKTTRPRRPATQPQLAPAP